MLISAFMLMATSVSLSEFLGGGGDFKKKKSRHDLNRIKSQAFYFQNANLFSAFCFHIRVYYSLSWDPQPMEDSQNCIGNDRKET